MECESLLRCDFLFDCANPPQAGLEDKAILINSEEIDKSATVFDATNPNIIKDLVLKAGARGYRVDQKKGSFNGTKWEMTEGTYTNGTIQTFAFVAFDRSAKGKECVEKIMNGSFVAIIQNLSAPDSSLIEILGYDTPLTVPTGSQDYVTEDASGNIVLTLASKFTSRLPRSLFDTDRATTLAKFESLYESIP